MWLRYCTVHGALFRISTVSWARLGATVSSKAQPISYRVFLASQTCERVLIHTCNARVCIQPSCACLKTESDPHPRTENSTPLPRFAVRVCGAESGHLIDGGFLKRQGSGRRDSPAAPRPLPSLSASASWAPARRASMSLTRQVIAGSLKSNGRAPGAHDSLRDVCSSGSPSLRRRRLHQPCGAAAHAVRPREVWCCSGPSRYEERDQPVHQGSGRP